MPRHTLQPLPRAFAGHRDPGARRHGLLSDDGLWERLDRCQVLGNSYEGHTGCVNALSWSDDGSILLSGSDDKKSVGISEFSLYNLRICIWTSDTSNTSPSSASPHPLKLADTIATGHRNNIFSAKFLPNASSSTIVSCAGDYEVRVFDVEKLGRREVGDVSSSNTPRSLYELHGRDGPGVRVLRCHTDRTKKIATENSPSLFLTVSEDGTVRQHDLRRPHQCRSECPEPLFRAPHGVDLYSLSVSTVTPHIFAVAGRTECAYVCDRRMPERQTPSWGNSIKGSGQVHCVRKLGLSEAQWGESGMGRRSVFSRHITCVKMSSDNADEVICAFADHSTSLFSIYDSPSSSSIKAKSPSPTVLPPNAPVSRVDGTRQHLLPSRQKAGASYAAQDFEWDSAAPSQHFKRRQSEVSESSNSPIPLNRARISSAAIANDDETSHQAEGSTSRPTTRYAIQDLANEIVRDARSHGFVPTHSEGNDRVDDVEFGPETLQARLRRMEEWDGDDVLDNTDEDGHYPLVDDWDDEMELDEDDFDDYDDEDGYDEVEDDADLEDLMDEDEDDGLMGYVSPPDIFSNVDFITPRRCFKGAKNSETVKDCNFLGSRSDKVCSGSDDGNFFVWDKDTGKLEGIWEGDGQIVNVMEQHPTLPMVAVSGIDNTVKLFSPMFEPPDPSFSRLHLQESIIRANTTRPRYQTGSSFGSASLLDFLSSRGVVRFPQHDDDDSDDEDDEGIRGQPQCATQ